MKKRIKYYFWVVSLTIILGSCTSDENKSDMMANLEAQVQQVQDLVTASSWSIESYIDSGVDETDDYAGYVFTFNSDGSLLADNGSNQIEGSWSVTGDDDSNDSSSDDSMDDDDDDDIDFNIFFSAPDRFAELADDWDIVSHNDNRVELIDISGGDGSIDRLIFIRN